MPKLLSLMAALALGAACERHPKSELEVEHSATNHGTGETSSLQTHETGTMDKPAGLPHNPAGANPVAAVDEHTKAEKAPAANAGEGPSPKTSETPAPSGAPAPKFFPGNQ